MRSKAGKAGEAAAFTDRQSAEAGYAAANK
jgi:hypothetical protein